MDRIFFNFFFFAGLFVPTSQPNDWAWSHRRQPRLLCLLSVAASPCSGTTINNSSSLSSTTSLPSERRPSCLTPAPTGKDAAKQFQTSALTRNCLLCLTFLLLGVYCGDSDQDLTCHLPLLPIGYFSVCGITPVLRLQGQEHPSLAAAGLGCEGG